MACVTWEKEQINRKFPYIWMMVVVLATMMGGVLMKSHATKHSLSGEVRKSFDWKVGFLCSS